MRGAEDGDEMPEERMRNGCDYRCEFTDLVSDDLDMRLPIALCSEHANEILETFELSDVAGVKEWLNARTNSCRRFARS